MDKDIMSKMIVFGLNVFISMHGPIISSEACVVYTGQPNATKQPRSCKTNVSQLTGQTLCLFVSQTLLKKSRY